MCGRISSIRLSALLARLPTRKIIGSSMTSTSSSVISEAPSVLRPPMRGSSFSEYIGQVQIQSTNAKRMAPIIGSRTATQPMINSATRAICARRFGLSS